MIMAYRGSDDELAGREAAVASEGAARYVEYLMTNVTNDGDLPDVTTYQSQAAPVGNALFWLIGVPQPSNPPGTPVYGLVDEASKLNLNRASATILENLPGMTYDLAEAIVNWRSTAGSAASQTSGAAAGISSTSVKEAPFESAEELAQVDGGVDLTTLYGNDTNLNHVLDPWEDNGGSGQINSGLLEYVTAFSREPKVRRDGTSRVNVTVKSPGLTALLNQTFTGGRGAQLLRAAGGNNVTIHSVLEFYVRSGMTAAELGQISPYLTMSSNQYNIGLVNVNTASAIVLACLPGMTTQLASQLVAARQLMSTPSSDLSWVAPILGNAVCIEAGPYLTTRSYQVTADVAATGRHGHGYRRTQFVIDTSTITSTTGTTGTTGTSSTSSSGAAQIVYRRDLSGLGWALGSNARQATLTNGGAQ
jgi:DNA uptake protein ComE-like DNA-binding protein